MFRFVSQITAALLLVLAGTLAPAAAEDRPLTASGAGNSSDYGMSAYGFEATHLGRAHFNGELSSIRLRHSQRLEFQVYLTAANFDRLYLDCVVDYVVNYDTGIGIAIGTATFNGGTGRFQDASGSADVMFVVDVDSYDFYNLDFLIDGSIDY